jgi:[ribosomal protein S5]-alanine N-acetyltransferase
MRVEPVSRPWIEPLVEGDDVFTERFGIAVVEGWAGFPEAILLAHAAAQDGMPAQWSSHLFFDDDGALGWFRRREGPTG